MRIKTDIPNQFGVTIYNKQRKNKGLVAITDFKYDWFSRLKTT